jgi:hypothetical protein
MIVSELRRSPSLCSDKSLEVSSVAIYASCSSCGGNGSFKCKQCRCSTCNASGRIKQQCGKCHGTTQLTCNGCSGSGQVLVKKGWFSDKYEPCHYCGGSRQRTCGTCKQGTIEVTCQACQRTGAAANCANCHGKGKTPCAACSGTGKVRPNWSRDRIREEIVER